MAKNPNFIARTVHVTVTFSVDVPASEANTDRAAEVYAMNHLVLPRNHFRAEAKVFDRYTEAERADYERMQFLKAARAAHEKRKGA